MKKMLAALLLLVLLVSGLYLYGRSAPLPSSPVRIAINPWPGYEYLYLAEQKGFFADEGLDVVLKQFSSLEDVRLAFERGQIDGMCTTLVEVLQAWRNTGKAARVVLVTDYSNGADVILAGASVSTLADLKGKNVAVEPMTLGAFILRRALEKAGLSSGGVSVFGYGQLQMKDALVEGKVDAVVSYPPMSVNIDAIKGVRKIFDTSEIPGEVVDVVSLTPQILDAYPEVESVLRRVWDRAVSYAKEHPKEAIAIMAQREGITPDQFIGALKGVKILLSADQKKLIDDGTLAADIERTALVLRDAGELEHAPKDPLAFIFYGGDRR